jgi:hypothetical protein
MHEADVDEQNLGDAGGQADDGDSLIDDDLFDDEDRFEALEDAGSSDEDRSAS